MCFRTLVVCALLAGCQTYEFNPVTPLTLGQTTLDVQVTARSLKPNVMLLVDKSGSMSETIVAGCTGAGCATRISELRSSMDSFLTANGTQTRLGLTFFPADATCGPSAAVAVPLPTPTVDDTNTDAALTATANQVKSHIDAISPLGGTPTASSLSFVGSLPGLTDQTDGRADWVILLTDGLPNCNASNPNNLCACGNSCSAAQVTSCGCTTMSCMSNLCAAGCLDQDGTVQTVAGLQNKGIRTVVVGFGADTAGGPAAATLTAMANAGGFPRNCKKTGTDADCGLGNHCDATSKLCSTPFFQASNAAELSSALTDIFSQLVPSDLCTFPLAQQPSEPGLIAVLVDDVDVPASSGAWSYTGGAIVFDAASTFCQRIKASTTQRPVHVVVRVVQKL